MDGRLTEHDIGKSTSENSKRQTGEASIKETQSILDYRLAAFFGIGAGLFLFFAGGWMWVVALLCVPFFARRYTRKELRVNLLQSPEAIAAVVAPLMVLAIIQRIGFERDLVPIAFICCALQVAVLNLDAQVRIVDDRSRRVRIVSALLHGWLPIFIVYSLVLLAKHTQRSMIEYFDDFVGMGLGIGAGLVVFSFLAPKDGDVFKLTRTRWMIQTLAAAVAIVVALMFEVS